MPISNQQARNAYARSWRRRQRAANGVPERPSSVHEESQASATRKCRTCGIEKLLAAFALARQRNGSRTFRHSCHNCEYVKKKQRGIDFPEIGEHRKAVRNEWDKERRRTPQGWAEHAVRKLRYYAKRHGLPFNLTVELIAGLIPADGLCPALGVPFVFGGWHRHNPSVDRLKPELGYVAGNVAVITMKANGIKNDATLEELEKVLAWVKSKSGTPPPRW